MTTKLKGGGKGLSGPTTKKTLLLFLRPPQEFSSLYTLNFTDLFYHGGHNIKAQLIFWAYLSRDNIFCFWCFRSINVTTFPAQNIQENSHDYVYSLAARTFLKPSTLENLETVPLKGAHVSCARVKRISKKINCKLFITSCILTTKKQNKIKSNELIFLDFLPPRSDRSIYFQPTNPLEIIEILDGFVGKNLPDVNGISTGFLEIFSWSLQLRH